MFSVVLFLYERANVTRFDWAEQASMSKCLPRLISTCNNLFLNQVGWLLSHFPWLSCSEDLLQVLCVEAHGQHKWWFARRWLSPQVVGAYEFIFVWDEVCLVAPLFLPLCTKHASKLTL